MEHIIHQMALNLAKKLIEIFKSDKKIGLEAWTSAALEESKKFSVQVVETAIQHKNEEIRAHKSQRKEWGLVLKEKERPRSILTELGTVQIARDCYYDKRQECYVTPLDTLLKIRPYERIGDEVSARLVREATDMSYAQSAADWRSIHGIFQVEERIRDYNHQRVQVMDGYRLEKYLQALIRWYPKHSVCKKLGEYIQRNEKEEAKKYCEKVEEKSSDQKTKKKTIQIKKFILNHWKKIVRRKTEEIPGSCTEGQVSHVLSERFSRHPMGWSKKALGQLSKLRVHVKNGEEIKAEYFQKMKEEESQGLMQWEEKLDWSVFEKETWDFQQGNGTQEWIHSIGKYKDIFMS